MGEHKLKICPHCGKELEPKVEEVDYEVQVIQCSPKAAKYVKEVEDINAGCFQSNAQYPFSSLPVGYSFCYPLSKRGSLCSLACIQNKKGEKQFKVIAHKEHGVCEVVRIK